MTARQDRQKKRQQDIDKRNQDLKKNKGGDSKTRETIFLGKKGDKQSTSGVGETPTIHLNNAQLQDNSLSGQRANLPDTFGGNLLRFISDPKLTVVLATTLATMGVGALVGGGAIGAGAAGGRAAGAAGRLGIVGGRAAGRLGSITRTATVGRRSMTTQRAIIGKSSQSKSILKLFKNPKTRAVVSRYATNTKSTSLTRSLLKKMGLGVTGAAVIGTIVGTYPFAEFELAEATDKIGIAIRDANQAGNTEKVLELTNFLDDIVNKTPWEKLLAAIPFANIYAAVRQNIRAARKSAATFRELAQDEIDRKASGEPTEFESSRIASDEAAFERKREFGEEETERFDKIRAENEERALDLENQRRERELLDRERDALYFQLIREGKYAEADALLQQELQGG